MTELANKVSIILPVYNEAGSISGLINEISAVDSSFEIIVVDDASSDNSADVARKAGARVISHPYNRGNGAAIKTGALSSQREIILLMDADGQHRPADIPELLKYIPKFDMSVGARSRKANISKYRGIGNLILKKVAELLSEHKIPDLTSGFRAIKRDKFLEIIHLLPERYSYPTTITIALLKSGKFVKYVDLDTIGKRLKGSSNIRPIRDGFRIIKIILRIIMMFDPQKIFFPLSLTFILLGLLFAAYTIIFFASIRNFSVLMVLTGVFTFLFGLLSEQVSLLRRDIGK